MSPALEIGGFHQMAGVVSSLPHPVDLQFYAKVALSFPIENRVGLVVIVVDFRLAAADCVAAVA